MPNSKVLGLLIGGTGLLGSAPMANAVPVDEMVFEFASNGHFYAWIDEPLSWPDANTAAGAYTTVVDGALLEDWHLVTITSQSENDFVAETVLGLPSAWIGPIGAQRAWMGLFNEFGATNFEWVTGEPTTYTNWFPGEPNNPTGTVGTFGRYSNGQWNDEFNDPNNGGFGPLAFLIEHGPATEPPSPGIPEPGVLVLMTFGLAGLGFARRYRRSGMR